jgi:membrane protease subunit HflC
LAGFEVTAEVDGETRNAIARSALVQVVRTGNRQPETTEGDQEETGVLEQIETGRAFITSEIQRSAAPRLTELGIELVDFQLKRINYVAEVQQEVFERMIAERQRIAEQYRSEGEGESARIRGERERDLQTIQSEAYRKSQETRGMGDAEAARIYAEAYDRDRSFYAFTKSLETLEIAIDPDTLLILTTEGDLLRYLDAP